MQSFIQFVGILITLCLLSLTGGFIHADETATDEEQLLEEKEKTISKNKPEDEEVVVEMEDLLITGSRIKSIHLEIAAPLLTVDREEISLTQSPQISDLIRQLPITAGASEADQSGSFAGDGAQANLRGTGVGGTLVLLNGRRLAPYAFSTGRGVNFVDLNAIPVGALEKIEILKEGGSAIYGSDAHAGVINFILRKDFEGAEVQTFYGNTTRGDDFSNTKVDIAWGGSSPNSNLAVFINYLNRNSIRLSDRSFSESANHSDKGGFDLRDWASYPGIFSFTFGSDAFFFIGDGTAETAETYERFNFNEFKTAISAAERRGTTLIGNYKLSDNIEFFTEFSYQKNKSESQFAPSALDRSFTIPSTNPYNPTINIVPEGLDITDVLLRPTDTGPRLFEIDSESLRVVTGLNGQIGTETQWEIAYLETQSEVNNLSTNLIRVDLFQEALNAPGTDALNPFASGPGEDNNEAIYDRITTDDIRYGKREFSQFSGGISTELFELRAGKVLGYLGGEYREESMVRNQSELAENFLLFGSGGTSAKGGREINAIYGELAVPLTPWLESHFALRREEYSDFGNSINPKIGLNFQPSSKLLVRASYSEGFQAPSLEQAFGGTTRGFIQERDLLRYRLTFNQETGMPFPFDDFRSRDVRTTGNPNLKPEESRYFNIGVVYNPAKIKDLTIGVNFWRLEIDDVISTRRSLGLLQREVNLYNEDPLAFLTMDPEVRGETTEIFRKPNTFYRGFTVPGHIDFILNEQSNFEGVDLQGLDFELFYHYRTQTQGDFWLRSYTVFFDQFISGGFNLTGFRGVPEFQSRNSLQWVSSNRDFSAFLSANYSSGYQTIYVGVPQVGSFTNIDLNLTYSGLWDMDITLGFRNLFDRDPPANVTRSEGYDENNGAHNPYGRMVFLSLKKRF
jgi:iron complex outermembrane receptor protein